jgi:superfamily II DNA helicase RecQ
VTYVKSRAEAERIAKAIDAACWHSKLDEVTKSRALSEFRTGKKKLVTTYGLGVGLNLLVRHLVMLVKQQQLPP